MLVMKFGGASTHTALGVRGVVEIILAHRAQRPLVVVSAIGKTTRAIDRAAHTAAEGNARDSAEQCREIIAMHVALAEEALIGEHRAAAVQRIDEIGARLAALIEGVAIVRELSPRSLDACLGLGEHLASVLMEHALRAAGAAVCVVPAESVMITNESHGHAVPRFDLVADRVAQSIAPMIAAGNIVLTEGYVGATEQGTPTTMGMESSDFSATVLGAALHAEEVQIWSNVDGMMTVDPRLCDHARTVPLLTYDEAEELAALGAKVLHPRTIGPVRDAHIPLTVRNCSNPEGPGTRIDVRGASKEGAKALAVVSDLRRVTGNLVADAEYRFVVASARHTAQWVGAGDPSPSTDAIAAVSVVGDGVGRDRAGLRAVLERIAACDIEAVCFGASPRSVSVLVPIAQRATVVAALHEHFLSGH